MHVDSHHSQLFSLCFRREVAAREIISRHCHAGDDCETLNEKERLLINSMKVPPQWIYEAKVSPPHSFFCKFDLKD